MKRRQLFNIVLPLIILSISALIFHKYYSGSPGQKGKNVNIVFTLEEGIDHAPMIIGYERSFFKEAGLHARLIPLASGGEVKQALAAGSADIASGGAFNFLIAIAKNAPVKIVAFSSLTPLYLYVRPDSGLDTFKKLEGRNIACRPGGNSELVIRYISRREGFDAHTITCVDIDKSLRPQALMKSKIIDATLAGNNEMNKTEEAGAVLHKEWIGKGYSDLSIPGAAVIYNVAINTDSISKNPDILKAFVSAFIKTQSYIEAYPEESAKILNNYLANTTAGVIAPSVEQITKLWKERKEAYMTWQDPNILVELSSLAKEVGMIDRALTKEELFDLTFENELKKAQEDIYGKKQN